MKLRKWRENANMTRKELATTLDRSASLVQAWETGRTIPRDDDMQKILTLTGQQVKPRDFKPAKDGSAKSQGVTVTRAKKVAKVTKSQPKTRGASRKPRVARTAFLVSLKLPTGVSSAQMKRYILGEVQSGCVDILPGDPMFNLDPNSVVVSTVKATA